MLSKKSFNSILRKVSSLYAHSKLIHPYQIVVFRHAEKIPGEALDGPLNIQGQQRAAYLVHFLLKTIIDQNQHEIVAFFVPNPYANPSQYYIRPTQTILPLFREANAHLIEKTRKTVYLNQAFGYTNTESVFDEFLYDEKYRSYVGKTIVVCWEHKNLPHLFDKHFSDLKPKFKYLGTERFDVMWLIRWEDNLPKAYTLYQIPSYGFSYPTKGEKSL